MDSPSDEQSIAFICAMPMEIRPLIKKLSLPEANLGGVTVRMGRIGDRRVIATVTGMGTKLARAGATRLLDAVPVERVLVVGITGAVDNVTPIGTLVLPEAVVDSETGSEHRPAPLGDGTPHGKMWTGDTLLTDPGVLAELRARDVVSLDMETAAVAEVSEARGVPWSVFRVVSDRATEGTINDEVFHLSNLDGTLNKRAVARYFLRRPGHLPRMVRLAKDATRAADAAADAAIRACSAI